MLDQGLHKETPELFSLAIYHTQLEQNSRERSHSGETAVYVLHGWLRSSSAQGIEHPLIIFTRPVDRLHDSLIAANQKRRIHPRLEVKSADGVIPSGVLAEQS